MIIPTWKVAKHIQAVSSTRDGGVSLPPYDSLNLGQHVGDDVAHVSQNRARLMAMANLPAPPVWLNQTHSTIVANIDHPPTGILNADGVYTQTPGIVCAVMTADCVPVLMTDKQGMAVAAVHAGWRGLANGILENAVALFDNEVLAWVGPCIGKQAFEVGDDVVEAFVKQDVQAQQAFDARPLKPGKWLGDLNTLVTQRLTLCGVRNITVSGLCTYHDPQQFFSYRRDGTTGRQASMIWISR